MIFNIVVLWDWPHLCQTLKFKGWCLHWYLPLSAKEGIWVVLAWFEVFGARDEPEMQMSLAFFLFLFLWHHEIGDILAQELRLKITLASSFHFYQSQRCSWIWLSLMRFGLGLSLYWERVWLIAGCSCFTFVTSIGWPYLSTKNGLEISTFIDLFLWWGNGLV